MPFPRAPKKPIRGKLKLVITNPKTEVVVETTPQQEDLSDQLRFTLPRGFNFSEDYVGVLKGMYVSALKRIDDIENRTLSCRDCENTTSTCTISSARTLLETAHVFFTELSAEDVSYILGHVPGNEITIEFRKASKALFASVTDSTLNLGRFEGSKLVDHTESRATPLNFLVALEWLLGVGE